MPFYSFPFGTSIAFDFCMRVIFVFVNFSKLVSNLWCKWTKRTRIRNKRKKTKTSEPLKFRKKNIHLLESWFKREKKSLRKSNLNAWMTDIIKEIAVFFRCVCVRKIVIAKRKTVRFDDGAEPRSSQKYSHFLTLNLISLDTHLHINAFTLYLMWMQNQRAHFHFVFFFFNSNIPS